MPEDRAHQSRVVTVPIVLLERYLDPDAKLVLDCRAVHFDVVRRQHIDSSEEWIFLGDDEHQLEVSLESATRLLNAVTETVK